jgi:DNA adenine methylase
MRAVGRPVLRYHGGKYVIAPWIVKHLPPHRIYVEPFGGAGSVLMAKPRSYSEVYNDLDGEVVNLFRVLRDPETGAQLERLLRLTPFARAEFEASYQPSDDPVESARRLVVRCFLGFGSTAMNSAARTGFRARPYRQNQTGAGDWANYPDAIPAMVDRLRGCLIEQQSAVDVIRRHDTEETVIYADPPYPHASRTSLQAGRAVAGKHCYRHEMTDDDHRELAVVLRSVAGMVVLSGYPCDLYDIELYPDWHRVTRSALADGARKRTEVLWLNAAAVAALPATLL